MVAEMARQMLVAEVEVSARLRDVCRPVRH